MGRLIDADANREQFKKVVCKTLNDITITTKKKFELIMTAFDNMPTAYDIENVQNETREYFKNKINNASTSKTTDGWDMVEFNADIHKIIGKGGVE